jgi:hypothetical protein
MAAPASAALLGIDAVLAAAAIGVALWLRPWRCVGAEGPPWVWVAAWAAIAVLWLGVPEGGLSRPMTGVTLLVLMAGWPLAVLAMLGAALLAALGQPLPWDDALQRLVWLGIAPGTCVLTVGAAVRRWLPRHLFAYISGSRPMPNACTGHVLNPRLKGSAAAAVARAGAAAAPDRSA